MSEKRVNEKPIAGSPLADAWSIRPCSTYKDEYNDCTSIKSRFHQYFIHGEMTDCKDWLQDYKNCKRYQDSNGNDIEAGAAIIQSEEERRTRRFRGHFGNTIWQKRKAPPDDWSKPLPEWMEKHPNVLESVGCKTTTTATTTKKRVMINFSFNSKKSNSEMILLPVWCKSNELLVYERNRVFVNLRRNVQHF